MNWKGKLKCFLQAFPLGSPYVSDISRQILNLTEGGTMKAIENKWFLGEKHCFDSTTSSSPIQLDHHSFQALFLMVFVVSMILLLLMLASRRYQERQRNVSPKLPCDQDNAVKEEVNEQGNFGDHIVEVDAALNIRRKKLTSKTIPSRRVAPLSRLKSA